MGTGAAVTRLGSPAGSFVQSPAGAFLQEGAAAESCGFVKDVQDLPTGLALGINSSNCSVTVNGNAPVAQGRSILSLEFNPGVSFTAAEMLATEFEGLSSGVRWRPIDYNISLQCSSPTQHISHDNLGPASWAPFDPNIDSWGYISIHNFTTAVVTLATHRNYGQFPAAPPLPAYVIGEDISCTTPPLATGTVTSITDSSLGASVELSDQDQQNSLTCRVQPVGEVPGPTQETVFTFDIPNAPQTLDDMLSGTYVGDVSGASYNPKTFVENETLIPWCTAPSLDGSGVWVSSDWQTYQGVLFPLVSASQLCEPEISQSGIFLGAYMRVTPLTFIAGETFTFIPD